MSDDEVHAFLDERHMLDLATLRADGSVHLVGMWYVLINGQPTMLTFAGSAKERNLRRDSRVTCLVQSGDRFDQLRGVSVVGSASISRDPSDVRHVADAMRNRLDGLGDSLDRALDKRVAITVRPQRVLSWDHRRFARSGGPNRAARIVGASVSEQALYDHLTSHVANEAETLREYEALASTTSSVAFKYLAGLILDDERRHHEMLTQLAESVRTAAELSERATPVPHLDLRRDSEQVLAVTERLLQFEVDDNRDLRQIDQELRNAGEVPLWRLVTEVIQADNEKHQRILRFIREHARP
jgi:PPOX class probable F420-dependent enzyme